MVKTGSGRVNLIVSIKKRDGHVVPFDLSKVFFITTANTTSNLPRPLLDRMEIIQLAQGTKISKIIAEIERVKAKMKVDVLIVDYLGVIGTETHHPGRPDLDEYNVSQRLQSYGKVNRYVTISASQLKTPSMKGVRDKARRATMDDPSKVEINTEDMAGSKMIPADADNALGVALNNDKPSTKMYVYSTKARDDESRRIVTLDFDGRIGRVSDPLLESGQVTEVDQIIYNANISEKELNSDDGLFDEIEKATTSKTIKEEKPPEPPQPPQPLPQPLPEPLPESLPLEETITPPEIKEVIEAIETPYNLPMPNKDNDDDVFNIG